MDSVKKRRIEFGLAFHKQTHTTKDETLFEYRK